jgi:hypothetical protein
VQTTEHRELQHVGRPRAALYGLLGVIVLTAAVLVMLAHQALA